MIWPFLICHPFAEENELLWVKQQSDPLLSSLIPVFKLIRDYLVLCKPKEGLQRSVLPPRGSRKCCLAIKCSRGSVSIETACQVDETQTVITTWSSVIRTNLHDWAIIHRGFYSSRTRIKRCNKGGNIPCVRSSCSKAQSAVFNAGTLKLSDRSELYRAAYHVTSYLLTTSAGSLRQSLLETTFCCLIEKQLA